ncbi:MAG: hypothetical protein WAT39_00770 [Planctomycetota bacterium]
MAKTPTLAPRTLAPRLSVPRSSTRTSTSRSSAQWYRRSNYSHSPSRWYRDHQHAFTFSTHCSSFSVSLSLWYPFWYWQHGVWDSCYRDAFWSSWSNPWYASSSYWWYPRSIYSPSYLYVPSTVVVYDTPVTPPAPAAPEVVVARAAEKPASTDSLAAALAAKYVELGDFYFKAERFAEAAEAYGKARGYAPDDASVHFVFADAVFANGDYHYAAFLIAEGLRLDPAMAGADTDKRTFYADAKVFDAQMAALASYLEKNDYDAQAWLVRGYNLAFSMQPADAIAAFRRVLAIDAGNRAASTFLAALAPEAPSDR